VSENGTLAYLAAVNATGELGLVSRDGRFQPLSLPPGNFERPRVSPDGHSIAYLAGGDLYVYDLERGSTVKLTQDGKDDGMARLPDSRSLAVDSKRSNGASGIFLRKPDGAEQPLIPLANGWPFGS